VNPDRLAELEDERRFLLRSLRDLDAELAAGDVDTTDYGTLRDGYTKRAADVLREIEVGKSSLPSPPPRRWARRLAAAAVVVVIAAGVGWLVARSSGQRLGDEEITGGAPSDDVAVLLARARAMLGVDAPSAQRLYEEVLAQRPEHPEALTYSGWLLFTASSGASADVRVQAVEASKAQLARAVAADPTYPDPHCFLAVIAANEEGAAETARTEVDRCLELDPPADVRALVEQFAADLD
jgi:hypothetical protein